MPVTVEDLSSTSTASFGDVVELAVERLGDFVPDVRTTLSGPTPR